MDNAISSTKNTPGENGTVTTTTEPVTITITLTKDGVKSGTADVSGTLKAALEEYVPSYAKIKKKSNQWTKDPTATLTIDKDGGVTPAYTPSDFATYADNSSNN